MGVVHPSMYLIKSIWKIAEWGKRKIPTNFTAGWNLVVENTSIDSSRCRGSVTRTHDHLFPKQAR